MKKKGLWPKWSSLALGVILIVSLTVVACGDEGEVIPKSTQASGLAARPTPTQASSTAETPTPTFWTSGGPSGGSVQSLAMAATNPDILYAGTIRGVFKTVDGGATWTKGGSTETLVRVIQVAPHNPDIVYAGTDDGIYKSEDGGSTWIHKRLPGARVNAIAIDPLEPNTLYAATGEPLKGYSSEIIGIFKSTDAGETWHEKLSRGHWAPERLDAVTTLLIDADNSSYIYAGVYDLRTGFQKSTDGGETWVSRRVNPNSSPWADSVDALAMTPAGFDPSVIYAIGYGGVYKSQDRGESWTLTNTPRYRALAFDPNSPNTVYVGTFALAILRDVNFYKSTDGGGAWLTKAEGLPALDASSIVIDPRNSAVYVGLENGVYKSTDGAESWNISSQGINETYIEGLAVDPTSSDTVFATVKGMGLARTTTGGTSWDYLAGPTTNLGAVTIDPQSPSTIWVGDGYHRDKEFYV
ncbi:MAG: hypothetical protein V3U90_03535, partial [Dehalococcoidia bacterium]